MKIDTSRNFHAFSQTSPLNWIIRDSTFEVEQGSKEDWRTVLDYFEHQSEQSFRQQSVPVINFGPIHVHAPHKQWLQSVQKQADEMYGLYGGRYSGGSSMPGFDTN